MILRLLGKCLRTGYQDREYSLEKKSRFQPCFLGSIFFPDPSQESNGTCYNLFSDIFTTFEFKMITHFFVKPIGLCQLLQLFTDFDEIFKNYSLKFGII